MSEIVIEFTDDTLVYTENGIEKLIDLLRRPVEPVLWAIKWKFNKGISFHNSHKSAEIFAQYQKQCRSDGPMKLVKVSEWLFNKVKEVNNYWTTLKSFDEAELCKEPLDLKKFAWIDKEKNNFTIIAITTYKKDDVVIYTNSRNKAKIYIKSVDEFCKEYEATYQLN